MKIKKLLLRAFGKYRDREFLFSDEKLNLIVGSNEAGKTTLFEGLKTALAGFSPASREKFPYVPWGEEEASLQMELTEGTRVERRLRSSIQGVLERDGRVEKIGNNPLVDLDRGMIDNLYTLEAEKLVDLDRRSMELVFHEMMTTLEMKGVRNPRQVLEELDEKQKEIYAPRRSVSRLQQIDRRIEEVQKRWREAREAAENYQRDQESILCFDEDILRCRQTLEKLGREESVLLAARHRLEQYHELQKQRLSLRQEVLVRHLGESFLRELEQRQQELFLSEEAERRREEEIEGRVAALSLLEPKEEQFLKEREAYMEQLRSLGEESRQIELLCRSLEKEKEQLAQRFQGSASRVFDPSHSVEESFFPSRSEMVQKPSFLMVLSYLVLALVSGLLWFTQLIWPKLALILAGLSLFLCLWEIYMFSRRRRSFHRYREEFHLKKGMNPSDLDHLRSLQGQYMEKRKMLEERLREGQNLKQVQEMLLGRFGLADLKDLNPFENRLLLKEQHLRETMAGLEENRRSLMWERDKNQRRRERLEGMQNRLSVYSEDSAEALRFFKEDLKGIQLFDHLEQRWLEGKDGIPHFEEKKLALLQEEKEAVKGQLEEWLNERSMARQRTRLFEGSLLLQELQSELTLLEEERAEQIHQYNLLGLLKKYLEEQYQSFLQEHQPGLLERASSWLRQLTAYHYDGILSLEGGSLYLRSAVQGLYPLLPSHSKGTRNQVYLALRLSIIEGIEKGEAMPLFLDEVFINWDQERLTETLRALEEMAASRQIFIFTCHETLAEAIETQIRTNRITLEEL